MNIPFRIIFLFSMVLYLIDATAQSNTVDSLKRILQTHKEDQDTGLGLSLSYDIVKAHGGTLEVISKQGVGSEFIIQLPT